MLRALEHEDDFVRLLCFSVQSLRRTYGSCQWAWIASCLGQTCLTPSLRLARRLLKKRLRKKSRSKSAPKSALTAVLESWLLSILDWKFSSYQWLFLRLFAGDAETLPGVSGNEDVSTGVETEGQLRGRHIFVTRSLIPLAGGPSMMSLRLSTVEVGAGSCWSGRLMMVMFVFKWGIY